MPLSVYTLANLKQRGNAPSGSAKPMTLFVLFIFGAVILGSGAMLSPAWPTAQPRIGLAGTFALAIISGGAVFLTSLFGWQTLMVDYLLFALVVSIFLGGTLSIGQQRAEARGETLADADQGWPGPEDLALFGGFSVILIGVALRLAATTTAPDPIAELTLGRTFDVLVSPQGVQPPAFITLMTYLSRQLGQPIALVQISAGAVLALLNVWLLYDVGAELRDKRLGRVLAVAGFVGVLLIYLAGGSDTLMALAFAQAFGVFALRYVRHGLMMDVVAAGLMLGAVAVTQFSVLLGTLLAGGAALAWLLAAKRPAVRAWVIAFAGIPAVALLAISPWLLDLLL